MKELRKFIPSSDYLKKWNATAYHDFLVVFEEGIQRNNTLYRFGGLGGNQDKKSKYFLILKYVEEYYSDSITKDLVKKPHLGGRWCILDQNFNEMIEFKVFDTPYLLGGLLYTLNHKVYNIETGYCYGHSYYSLKSEHFVFINDEFNKDDSKRGVIKINKETGEFELFQ